jgi:hypothetical protein
MAGWFWFGDELRANPDVKIFKRDGEGFSFSLGRRQG